jgi:hypothetical protein
LIFSTENTYTTSKLIKAVTHLSSTRQVTDLNLEKNTGYPEVFNITHLQRSCFTYVIPCHQLVHVIYTTSNTFRLSHPAIISELIIVDNKQLTVYNDKLPDDGRITQPKHVGGCVNKVQ